MNLPRLPELDDDFEGQEEQKDKREKSVKEGSKVKPKMPKSEYDSDGNPVLTVPNLDDINLFNEIDKYFGQEVDD